EQKAARKPTRDESISGSDSENDQGPQGNVESDEDQASSDSDHENETEADRRLRLAERYLESIKGEVDEVGFDAEQIDKDLIAERLKEDVAETKGRLYRHIASDFAYDDPSHTFFRADTDSTTSVAACLPYIYTVSKNMTLIKWRLPNSSLTTPSNTTKPPPTTNGHTSKNPHPPRRRRPIQEAFVRGHRHPPRNHPPTHTAAILAVAASEDGKFVATGGADRRLIIWNAADLTPLKAFTSHRDAITSLAFRRGTNQLFSSSRDRTIKLWSLDELAYIETLFGHQDEVVDVAALALEQCVSVGARDRTARLWKVVDETQLVFRAGSGPSAALKPFPSTATTRDTPSSSTTRSLVTTTNGNNNNNPPQPYAEHSVDAVTLVDAQTFITGSAAGTLALWTSTKKKPIHTVPLAHGLAPPLPPHAYSAETHPPRDAPVAPQPRWITALASVPYADLVVSGSWDGCVRVWRVTEDKRRIERVGELEGVRGVVNGLWVGEREGSVVVVVGVGKEGKGGRWMKVEGKNGGVVFEVGRRAVEEEKTDDGDEGETVSGEQG
ncbi:MAG: pre-rRNA processing protein, partial [Piccolia ochrophora]